MLWQFSTLLAKRHLLGLRQAAMAHLRLSPGGAGVGIGSGHPVMNTGCEIPSR
jgi:hypothetical protein